MNEKMQALFQNEDFMKEVLPMTPEDAVKAFAREGVDITVAELKELAAQINAGITASNAANGELTEENLAVVTGGMDSKTFWFAVGVGVGIGIVCAPW